MSGFKWIIMETSTGARIAIVHTIEDGRGLGETHDIKYLVEYSKIKELVRVVSELREEHLAIHEVCGSGVIKRWIPILISKGLLVSPPT